jgi:hypothetical protein
VLQSRLPLLGITNSHLPRIVLCSGPTLTHSLAQYQLARLIHTRSPRSYTLPLARPGPTRSHSLARSLRSLAPQLFPNLPVQNAGGSSPSKSPNGLSTTIISPCCNHSTAATLLNLFGVTLTKSGSSAEDGEAIILFQVVVEPVPVPAEAGVPVLVTDPSSDEKSRRDGVDAPAESAETASSCSLASLARFLRSDFDTSEGDEGEKL